MTTEQAATQRVEGIPLRNSAALERVAALNGRCLSIFIPGRHPGAPEIAQRTQAKTLLDAALKGATDATWAAQVGDTTRAFIDRSVPEGGGASVAIYSTGSGIQYCHAPVPAARSVVSDYPVALPLIEAAAVDQELWVLALNTKRIHLYEYNDGAVRPVALPGSVPSSLDAAGHFHASGVNGQSSTPGGKGGVRFGTSGMREAARDSFDHFCALIDHGLHTYLGGRPLLLMGVKEEIAAYRRVSTNASLLHAEVDGNVDTLTPAQLAGLARQAALEEYRRVTAALLDEARELRDRTRTLDDPHAILAAARDGRIHEVCLRAGTELQGPDGEEVLNAIAVETLRRGGHVYIAPSEQMPITQAACAILRY